MKGGFLMRVLLCKIQFPFICFCNPSGPLKLDNSPHVVVPSTTDFAVSIASEKIFSEEGVKWKQEAENVLPKSCLRKVPHGTDDNAEGVTKKRVQWIDIAGKQLAEIKEFESSETGDTDNEEESSRCLCIIL